MMTTHHVKRYSLKSLATIVKGGVIVNYPIIFSKGIHSRLISSLFSKKTQVSNEVISDVKLGKGL